MGEGAVSAPCTNFEYKLWVVVKKDYMKTFLMVELCQLLAGHMGGALSDVHTQCSCLPIWLNQGFVLTRCEYDT